MKPSGERFISLAMITLTTFYPALVKVEEPSLMRICGGGCTTKQQVSFSRVNGSRWRLPQGKAVLSGHRLPERCSSRSRRRVGGQGGGVPVKSAGIDEEGRFCVEDCTIVGHTV